MAKTFTVRLEDCWDQAGTTKGFKAKDMRAAGIDDDAARIVALASFGPDKGSKELVRMGYPDPRITAGPSEEDLKRVKAFKALRICDPSV